ncbi:MAG: hypothetical protein NT005_17980 [Spirochaetes bacterium]|nr:hypothetical protein [Spirochaetota bacterium]MCX7041006.1 hypothetical protein [Spirochaetota bacterium]
MLDEGPSPDYRALAGMLEGLAAPARRAETSDELPGFIVIDTWEGDPMGLSVRTVRFQP